MNRVHLPMRRPPKFSRQQAGFMRWLPWLLCLTGARLNEICQAEKDDVEIRDGVPVFRIHDEGDGRTVKNADSRRLVLLHPALVAECFLDYVAALPAASPLWPDVKPDAVFGLPSVTAGRKIGRWLRVDLKIDDPLISPNHSWRHWFVGACRRVVMPIDFLWMKLSDNQGLPLNEAGVNSIKAKMTETILTPKIGYRIADGKKVKVDALFGARYWHVSTTLTLQPQIANGLSDSANWADAVAGGRIQFALTPKASAMIFGDAGGASARLDYQVGGALGYQVSRRWVLLVGYRYLSVDYRPNSRAMFVYDVNMPGLAIGATFNVK